MGDKSKDKKKEKKREEKKKEQKKEDKKALKKANKKAKEQEKKTKKNKKDKKQSSASVSKVLKKFHAAIISQDWEALKKLFHPDFERYVFGHFNQEVIKGEGDVAESLKFLFAHGKFTLFNFTQPIGNDAEAVFRLEYTYIPNGVNLSFSNVHLIHIRISSKGLITFIDTFFDTEAQNYLLDTIASVANAEAEKK